MFLPNGSKRARYEPFAKNAEMFYALNTLLRQAKFMPNLSI